MQRKVVWKLETPGFPSLVRHIKAAEKKIVLYLSNFSNWRYFEFTLIMYYDFTTIARFKFLE